MNTNANANRYCGDRNLQHLDACAPHSITPIESKQTAPAAKFTITATLDGFPIQIEAEGKADSLRALIDRLKAIGAEPPQAAKPEPTATAPNACPTHGKAKPSKKPGFVYCPEILPDGGYCRWTGTA